MKFFDKLLAVVNSGVADNQQYKPGTPGNVSEVVTNTKAVVIFFLLIALFIMTIVFIFLLVRISTLKKENRQLKQMYQNTPNFQPPYQEMQMPNSNNYTQNPYSNNLEDLYRGSR